MVYPPLRVAILASALLAVVPTARADALISLADVSATSINSGDSFTFSIRMAGPGIASYLIPVLVSGPSGSNPGVDFDLSPPTDPPASGYVFGNSPTGNFDATLSTSPGSPTTLFLTIGDFVSGAVTDGSADLISWITVTTASNFVGTITVGFGDDANFEILNEGGDDVPFQHGNGFAVRVGGGVVIPEPTSVALLGVGGLAVAGLARRRRSF